MNPVFARAAGAMGVVAMLALAMPLAAAQGSTSDPVLVDNGKVQIHLSEYQAELLKLPPDIRAGFANSQKRIRDLLQRILVQKTLALQAQEQKLDQTPVNQTRLRLENERMLAGLRIEDLEAAVGREFDARGAQNVARARELYLSERKRFEVPEQVSASHILFALRRHSKEEALKLAEEARAKLLAGADFAELAHKVSEDPSVTTNGGDLGSFPRGQMDPAFTEAAFALKQPGDLSQPVLSSFGWHIIKLQARLPAHTRTFDEVKDSVVAEMRQRYIDERRDQLIASITNDPGIKVDEARVDALYIRPATGDVAEKIPSGPAHAETPPATTPSK